MANQNIKYQRLEVSYPNGTTAGVKKDHSIVLDPAMDKVVGIAMYPIADGGVSAIRLGLSDNSGEMTGLTKVLVIITTVKNQWIWKLKGDRLR